MHDTPKIRPLVDPVAVLPRPLRPRVIRFRRKLAQKFEKLRRLPNKEPIVRETLHRSHRSALGLRGTDDRTRRELSVQKWTRLRHDQVGLEILAAERRRVEIRKHELRIS